MRWTAIALLLVSSSLLAAEPDLSVGWIARNPKIDYVWDSTNPTVEGWPEEGSEVRWVSTVRWLGDEPLENVGFRWSIDGKEVLTGTLDFAPESAATSELPWIWTFSRHEIVFEIDVENRIDEIEERNNRLLIHTDALGAAFYVERTFWSSIRPRVRQANIGGTTFEDWMQRQIRHFNEMARYAIYDETPHGVLDRWRIDEIHVVEDGSLPLVHPYVEARDWGASASSFSTLYPNVLDHTVDMQWGFPASSSGFFNDATPWIYVIGNSLVHELAHARTMIDIYAWNITSGGDVVQINPPPPAQPLSGYIYATREHGLMHFDWGHIDRYSAVVMNRMAGRRAVLGNYNEPWDLGWFLNDLPESTRVRFVRTDGTPITGSEVRIYRATPAASGTDFPYPMLFDGIPDFVFTTDSEGAILLPRNPFTDDEITAFVDRMNGMAIAEIMDGATRRWAFLESLQFNLAYWRGETELAEYDVVADAPICRDALGPSQVVPLPEAHVTTRDVQFQLPLSGTRSIELYYAVEGGDPVRVDVPLSRVQPTRATLFLPAGRIVWWFVDPGTTPGCPPQRSSVYAFDHDVERLPRRRAVQR